MAKKYYKSLDGLLLAAVAARSGKHQEAAKHFVKAMEEDDAADLMEDLNEQQEESNEACDEGDAAETMAKVMAAASKRRKAIKAEAEEELDDEAEEELSSDDNTDATDVNAGEGESVEDQVTARLQARKARLIANKKALARK